MGQQLLSDCVYHLSGDYSAMDFSGKVMTIGGE